MGHTEGTLTRFHEAISRVERLMAFLYAHEADRALLDDADQLLKLVTEQYMKELARQKPHCCDEVMSARATLLARTGAEPSPADIAHEVGASESTVRRWLQVKNLLPAHGRRGRPPRNSNG